MTEGRGKLELPTSGLFRPAAADDSFSLALKTNISPVGRSAVLFGHVRDRISSVLSSHLLELGDERGCSLGAVVSSVLVTSSLPIIPLWPRQCSSSPLQPSCLLPGRKTTDRRCSFN
ncbi:hypothetical protein GE061_000353 [Apolygus lucorum]|uniref:Uncharacterized protein n=1 Tax=Apolygus lucorum TaxID=248454 RepID=A0A8S9Y6S7_APOLU|nr:hypothetical protein GE061_000353 [Apolygus lucorum]